MVVQHTAVLKMADEILTVSTESRSLDLRQVMGYTVDSITLLVRAQKQISNEWKKPLKPVLNEDIRGLCDKDITSSEHLFGENLVESMREAKENYRISNSIINTISWFGGKNHKISHNSGIGSKCSFDLGESSTRGSAGYSLNFQGRKKHYQHQRASHSSHIRFNSNIFICALTSFQLVAFPSKYKYGRSSPQILKCFRLLKE